MKTYTHHITQSVGVTLNEEAFTDEFMREFNEMIFEADLHDHARHLSQLIARGILQTPICAKDFVEGYGEIGAFIKSATCDTLEIENVISDE